MPGAPDSLELFLRQHFPGLELHAVTARPPQWPSLRFELGGDIPNDQADERIKEATNRASAIFEFAYAPEDEGFFSFTRWREDDDALVVRLVPPRLAPRRSDGHDFYDEGEATRHVTYTWALRPRSLDYRSLFRMIASSELGESPSIDGRAYIVNTSRPLIFHMYDDRGAIVVTTAAEALDDLRAQFGNWFIS